jgi:cytochrome c oxidase subunit 2
VSPLRWRVAVTVATLFVLAGCGTDEGRELSGTAEEGAALFRQLNCAACHPGVGPELDGAWGTSIVLDDDSTVTFDAAWVEESVRDPDARVRAGDWRRMPAFDERQLDADSLAAIVAYLEAVGTDGSDTTP